MITVEYLNNHSSRCDIQVRKPAHEVLLLWSLYLVEEISQAKEWTNKIASDGNKN